MRQTSVVPAADTTPASAVPELAVLSYRPPMRGRLRRLAAVTAVPTSAESDRVAAAGPLPVAVLRRREDTAALLTRLYATRVRGRGDVYVLQLTPGWACDLGAELAVAGRLLGEPTRHRDLTPDAPTDRRVADPTRSGLDETGPRVLSVRRPRIDGAALRVLRDGGAAVLAVDTARSSSAAVGDALGMLDGLGLEMRGLVVWRGRLPRDPAWGKHLQRG